MPARSDPIRTVSDCLLVSIFALGISLPLLFLLLRGTAGDGAWENRRSAELPRLEWTIASLAAFPERLEAYFDDHFGFRALLIRWDNLVRTLWLESSPRPGSGQTPLDRLAQEARQRSPWSSVVLGRDSWFYWFGGEMLEDYRGLRPFGADQLDAWRLRFEERRRRLARRGIPYLLVIAPEKYEIHPEHLPANLRRVRDRSRVDEFLDFMAEQSEVEILDLRGPLQAARDGDAVYYRTGTHWNEYGAYVASLAIAKRLETLVSGFVPNDLPPFEIHRHATPARGMLATFGMADRFDDVALELVPVDAAAAGSWLVREENDDPVFGRPAARTRGSAGPGAPRAIVFHDSFTRVHLEDFLSRHFQRIDFKWTQEMDFELIDRLRPDVVIEERASRFLINQRP